MFSADEEMGMVFLVRTDLSMSTGKIAVQVGHAAVDCALLSRKKQPRLFEQWRNTGSRKICLAVDHEEDLLYWKKKSDDHYFTSSLIRDAGRTEVPSGTNTVLGVGPALKRTLDDVFGELPLFEVG